MKKKISVLLALVLILAVAFTLVACGEKDDTPGGDNTSNDGGNTPSGDTTGGDDDGDDQNLPTYTLVDKDGNEDADGGYVLFGSYPQSEVKDDAVKSALAQKAGALPQNEKNGNWTSYKYPYGKANADGKNEMTNETDYMWYIDVKLDGETYRGVYFEYYRPNAAVGNLQDDSASTIFGYQKDNGYKIGNVYWFKYEPLLWQIIQNKDGKAQLLCMTAIDSQPYTLVIKKSENKFKDEKDEHYVFYNVTPDVPQNTLATNYQYSAIRAWLNGVFYQNAFNSKQKNLISETLLDNESGEVGSNTTDKVFVPSIAEIKDLKNLYRKASDYAKSQNLLTDYSHTNCDFWYTRDAFYMLRFQEGMLTYDSNRHENVCGVKGGYLYNSTGSTRFASVIASNSGVVPSLWIAL